MSDGTLQGPASGKIDGGPINTTATGFILAFSAALGTAQMGTPTILLSAPPHVGSQADRAGAVADGSEGMVDAALTKQVEALAKQIEMLAAAVAAPATAPARRTLSQWFSDNSAILGVGIMVLIAGLGFNDRLARLENNLTTLQQHVETDFRTLVEKIGALQVQLAHDETPLKKP